MGLRRHPYRDIDASFDEQAVTVSGREHEAAGGQLQERTAKDFMVVAYSTPVGNAAAYYPETNSLVPLDHTAAKSNTPVSKAIVIRLENASGTERSDKGAAQWDG